MSWIVCEELIDNSDIHIFTTHSIQHCVMHLMGLSFACHALKIINGVFFVFVEYKAVVICTMNKDIDILTKKYFIPANIDMAIGVVVNPNTINWVILNGDETFVEDKIPCFFS
jgi:hypothetical protein